MKYFGKKHLLPCLACTAAICLLTGALIPAARPAYRAANGLFCGGSFALLWGLFRLVRRLGLGDPFLYSRQRVRQLRGGSKPGSEDNVPREAPKSYFEYLENKAPGKPCCLLLAIGAVLVVLAFAVSFLFA